MVSTTPAHSRLALRIHASLLLLPLLPIPRHGFDRSFDARINAAIGDFARIHAANLSAAGGVRVMLQPPARSTAEGGAAAPPAPLLPRGAAPKQRKRGSPGRERCE